MFVLEVTQLGSAKAIGALLGAAVAISDRFGFVTHTDELTSDSTLPLALLGKHLVDESKSHDWPGTSSEEPQILRQFAVTPESISILRGFMEKRLIEHEWPAPGDLYFLRPDNSPVLTTISSDDDSRFGFSASELDLVNKSTIDLLGLREPLAPPLTHSAPVWADRADCVVGVPIGEDEKWVELIPSRRMAHETYEVCCIPFLADLALGDLIAAAPEAGELTMTARLRPSGREVAVVEVSLIRDSPRAVVSTLVAAGFLVEWPGDRLIVVNLNQELDGEVLSDLLLDPGSTHILSLGIR